MAVPSPGHGRRFRPVLSPGSPNPRDPGVRRGRIFFPGNLTDPRLFGPETSYTCEGREPEIRIFGKEKAIHLFISICPPPPFRGGCFQKVEKNGPRAAPVSFLQFFKLSLSAIESLFVRLFEGFWGADF